jgi:hypothetical protein
MDKSKRPESHPTKECARGCTLYQGRTKLLLLSHNFSNVMINSTILNEVHYTLLKQSYPTLYPASKTTVFFGPRTKNVSSPAKQICTPVLPTHQDEVLHDKLLPLPQPPVRARTDARTNPSAQRATQLRRVLARVYAVSIKNQITTTVP